MSKTTTKAAPQTPLQTTLADLQATLDGLKQSLGAAKEEKAYFEKQIADLYEQHLNERQMYEMSCAVIDERARLYTEVGGGMLDGLRTLRINALENRPLCFDDFEQIEGRLRVVGTARQDVNKDLVHTLPLVLDHSMGKDKWYCFFFGDQIKQKLADLYRARYGETVLTELESIADRSNAIAQLFDKVKALSDEITKIEAAIEEATRPVREFMRAG